MVRHPELVAHFNALLAQELWPEAAVYLCHAAQKVSNRSESQELLGLVRQLPKAVLRREDWSRALAWVAYRTADAELLDVALRSQPGRWPVFEGFRASLEERWQDTLMWVSRAEDDTLHSLEAIIAARFRACAMAELQQSGWQDAYHQAAQQAVGRDRGLILLELGHYLSSNGQESAARDVYAQAIPELRSDPWALTLTSANLGITCLRLGALADSERALRSAITFGQQGEGVRHLSTAWRGLGGLALHRGQLARAHHAFRKALLKADTPHERVAALRGSARVYRVQNHHDEAMVQLHEALRQDRVQFGQPHPVYADLAALHLLVGDPIGARERLKLVRPLTVSDGWRVRVVIAELARMANEASPEEGLRSLNFDQTWIQEEARVFPALFARLGVEAEHPAWTAQVSTDGPIRLRMNGETVDLRPNHVSASLLAFLALHGGQASAERVLEALSLTGTSVRARKQELSKAVGHLREVLGWTGAVSSASSLLALSSEVQWLAPELPPRTRSDLFCEGRLDPWVLEWRTAHARDTLRFPASF